jgi:hypothetical protein
MIFVVSLEPDAPEMPTSADLNGAFRKANHATNMIPPSSKTPERNVRPFVAVP